MKSTLLNMVLALLGVTALGSAAVGFVYKYTQEPIAQTAAAKKIKALAAVLPPFDNDPTQDKDSVSLQEGAWTDIYVAKAAGEIVGYAVESSSNGYAGPIVIITGFDVAGNIVNIEVLAQGETPGLGSKIAEPENPVRVSFVGRTPADLKMSVRKDGGDIDAITASTVSSRAYVAAVSKAWAAFLKYTTGDAGDFDTASGATASQSANTAEVSVTQPAEDAASGATASQSGVGTATEATVTSTPTAPETTAPAAGDSAPQPAANSASGATASQVEATAERPAANDSASGATTNTDRR